MRIEVRGYRVAKHGSSAEEYEDALAWHTGGAGRARFAVADGASESSFARRWAELLVGAYVAGEVGAAALAESLRGPQARWWAEGRARPQPWYVAAKVNAGAFAALAGLTLDADGGWHALAVGDCCVFHVRDDALLRAFPIASAAEFDNRPLLLSSNVERNERLGPCVPLACGSWQPGDTFLLMSDALAAAFLSAVVDEGRPVSAALPFGRRQRSFAAWVRRQRAAARLRNDDVSLLRIHLPATDTLDTPAAPSALRTSRQARSVLE
jgi:hypothetical protein